jgi:hypothetical protein
VSCSAPSQGTPGGGGEPAPLPWRSRAPRTAAAAEASLETDDPGAEPEPSSSEPPQHKRDIDEEFSADQDSIRAGRSGGSGGGAK